MINFFQNKIFLFFIFSVLNLLSYGISPWEYTIYNFDQLYYYVNSSNYIIDPIIQSTTFAGYLLNKFSLFFKFFLQVPFLYVLSSIFIKTLIYYSFYKITNLLIKKENLAVIITLFFLTATASASHHLTLNGFWGAPVFYRSSVSGLMTLIGLFLLIDKKILFSIIPFSISIHLHALYGLSSFAFIFFSFFFYFIYEKKQWINLIFLALIIALNALFILISVDNSSYELLNVSNDTWYQMLMTNDPEDVSILYPIGSLGYYTALVIISSLYFVLKERNKKTIDYLFLGSFFFFLFIIVIEITHYNLIFIDFISEKFISFQFRRGLWVIMFISTVINFINIDKIFNNNYKFPLIFLMLLFLKPDALSLFFIILTGIFYYKKNFFIPFFLISIFLLFFGIYNQYYIKDISSTILNFTFIIFSTFILFLISKYKKISTYSFFILILLVPVLTNTAMGLYKNTFVNQFKTISSSGILMPPKILDIETNIYKSQGKTINFEIINYIRTHNNNNDFVLESFSNLFYGDPIIYNSPVYISRYHLGYSLYSKNIYGNLLFRINNLIPFDPINNFTNKADLFSFLGQKINDIEKSQLEKLYTNYKIRFVILKKKMENYVVEENGYFLYDLKTINK
jgi:hypothetical protein